MRTYSADFPLTVQCYQPDDNRYYYASNVKFKWFPIPEGTLPNEIVKLSDDVWLRWNLTDNLAKSSYGLYGTESFKKYILTVQCSVDHGETWSSDMDYNWFRNPNNQSIVKKYTDSRDTNKAADRKIFNKQQRFLKKENLKKEAKKLGVTVEEISAQKSEKRKEKIEINKGKRSIVKTQNIIKLATQLNSLSAYIESIKDKIDRDDNLNLKYISNNLYKLSIAEHILKRINTSPKR